MRISVLLQDPFDYAVFWITLGLGLLAAAAVIWFVRKLIMGSDLRLPDLKGSLFRMIKLSFVKLRYSSAIRKIGRRYEKGAVGSRTAHQLLCSELRRFAAAATGEPVESMVYSELHGHPELASLIGEYYVPEFSAEPDPDINTLMQKSRELVKKWR